MDLAAAYRDGRLRLVSLLTSPGVHVERLVPLTPAWRVRDLLAHVIGVGEDLLAQNFPDFSDPTGEPEQAAVREQWTDAQVQRRSELPFATLIAHWDDLGPQIEAALASEPESARYPLASRAAATFDLGCHLHDVRHALGRPGDRDAPVTRVAFGIARTWLDLRLQRAGLGKLRLIAPERSWEVGHGEPAAAIEASAFDLFRAISGRRSLEQLRGLDWTGDPQPLLDVLSPYPPPAVAVAE